MTNLDANLIQAIASLIAARAFQVRSIRCAF
jgi:hypothetical protein